MDNQRVAAVALLFAITHNDSAWAQSAQWSYRADSKRSGDFSSPQKVPATANRQKPVRWKLACYPVTLSPSVASSRVFLGELGSLQALSLNKGDLLWRFTTATSSKPPKFTAPPAVSHNLVFFGDENGVFYAVDCANGTAKWTFKSPGSISSAPAIADNEVLFTSADGNLYNLDLLTGKLKWHIALRPAKQITPALDQSRLYLPADNASVCAVNLMNGQVMWRAKLDANAQTTTLSNHHLFVSAGHSIHVLDAKTGRAIWSFSSSKEISKELSVTPQQVLFTAGDTIASLDTVTGKLRWSAKLSSPLTPPSLANQLVYCGSSDGTVHVVDSASGQIKWRVKTGRQIVHSPVIADDTLIILSNEVYAIDINVVSALAQRTKTPYALDLLTNPVKKRVQL